MNHSELTLSFLVAAPKRYSWGQIKFLFPASTPSNYDLQKGNKCLQISTPAQSQNEKMVKMIVGTT
jgi:hypothetical protein